MIKLENDFKRAIVEMPQKDKDRLLLRLISKDLHLAEQLHFRLMEGEESIEERKQDVINYIQKCGDQYPKHFYSPQYLMVEMRSCSGKINHYRSITKDKVGEVSLQLIMLNAYLAPNLERLSAIGVPYKKQLMVYVFKRLLKIKRLIEKVHDDYHIEFYEHIEKLKYIMSQFDPENYMAEFEDVNGITLLEGSEYGR